MVNILTYIVLAAGPRRLVLMSAPPGFGKTTILST
jgi:ATP/maltotriose-dependent transcriptional regulator MalT